MITDFKGVVLMLVLELGLVFIQRIQHRASFFVRSSFIIYSINNSMVLLNIFLENIVNIDLVVFFFH